MSAGPGTAEPEALGAPSTETTLIFLHIGKTAGQTLSRVLRRNVPRAQRVRIPNPQGAKGFVTDAPIRTFAAWPLERRAQVRLIMSHMVFGIHEHVPGPATYLTLLREPVARVVSAYRYARRLPTHRLHDVVAGQGLSLESYALSGVAIETDNAQTRALAGDVTTPFGECGAALLETAKRNVDEHFPLAGLTEEFDEYLVLLHALTGFSRLGYVKANVARDGAGRERPAPAVLARIEQQNHLDVALYEHVRERFGQARAALPEFEAELRRLRARNRLYQPFGHLSYTLPRRAYARVRKTGW
jgi:hypothetical protein